MKERLVTFVIILFVVSSLSFFIIPSFAQSSTTIDEISLFIPEKMIVGEKYQGMITLLNPSSKDILFSLETDNDYILNYEISIYKFLPTLILQLVISIGIYIGITLIIDKEVKILFKSILKRIN